MLILSNQNRSLKKLNRTLVMPIQTFQTSQAVQGHAPFTTALSQKTMVLECFFVTHTTPSLGETQRVTIQDQ